MVLKIARQVVVAAKEREYDSVSGYLADETFCVLCANGPAKTSVVLEEVLRGNLFRFYWYLV